MFDNNNYINAINGSKAVLSVDDSEMNQLVIRKILEGLGYTTIIASNGLEAIQFLNEGLKPFTILMDLQMPEMNGMETSEYIRKKMNNNVPIIINSGNVEAYEKWRLSRMGIVDFLEKPYSINDIKVKLQKNIAQFV